MKTRIETRVGTVKLPATVFKKCSQCDSPNIWSEEGQVFCDYCGWNSIALYEECVAASEKRARAQQPTATRSSKVHSDERLAA